MFHQLLDCWILICNAVQRRVVFENKGSSAVSHYRLGQDGRSFTLSSSAAWTTVAFFYREHCSSLSFTDRHKRCVARLFVKRLKFDHRFFVTSYIGYQAYIGITARYAFTSTSVSRILLYCMSSKNAYRSQ